MHPTCTFGVGKLISRSGCEVEKEMSSWFDCSDREDEVSASAAAAVASIVNIVFARKH